LGNLVTNMNLPKCADSRSAYVESTVYAIQQLQLPNVSIYLDAAHAGWLGWDHHRESVIRVYKKVLRQAGGYDMIRGFAGSPPTCPTTRTCTTATGRRWNPAIPATTRWSM